MVDGTVQAEAQSFAASHIHSAELCLTAQGRVSITTKYGYYFVLKRSPSTSWPVQAKTFIFFAPTTPRNTQHNL